MAPVTPHSAERGRVRSKPEAAGLPVVHSSNSGVPSPTLGASQMPRQ
jgi:hypothetical protein